VSVLPPSGDQVPVNPSASATASASPSLAVGRLSREPVGLVDGAQEANTSRLHVVLEDNATLELDELVVTSQTLPDGTELKHFGIVVESRGHLEGAEISSDTRRITGTKTMPGATSRTAEVQVLRTLPEKWLPPAPGAVVRPARDTDRENALFLDQMDKPLALGYDQFRQPVYADFTFMNGEAGGHLSISGTSGVATKTSYACFVLYQLFETPQGRALLGIHLPQTRAIVFNVKGEDLLHLDRPNSKFPLREGALEGWRALGVKDPGPFRDVEIFAPQSAGARDGSVVPDITSRPASEVTTYGWTPQRFIREGLLRFCFAEADDARGQVQFIEQRVRLQLARWAFPLENEPGAVVLCEPDAGTSNVFGRVLQLTRHARPATDGVPIRDFGDLIDFLTDKVGGEDQAWVAGTVSGTCQAFMRRLYASVPRLGHLITLGVAPVELNRLVSVVDIHNLHDSAQRFVVGALLSKIFEDKQGAGREPLRFVVLDELNKYAPKQGSSPIKDVLIDIAARGRSLGVLLIGAQQSAADVDGNIIRNASLKVVGRLDAGEAGEYKFLSPEVRERASRFLPGTMVLDQPLIPAPLPLRFPFPAFATNVAEGAPPPEQTRAAADALMDRL
jgi:DNA helicase HerA-like ATPase